VLIPSRLRPWIPPLAITFLVLVFFSPFFLRGKVFLAADTLYGYYPWRSYAPQGFAAHNTLITDPVNQGYSFSEIFNKQLKQGRFVTWSPNILGGVPVANGRNYPLTLLFHLIFTTAIATTFSLVTHIFLMGLFMYLYLKEIGAGNRGAVFGAVAFMFNGCAMVWLTFETVIPHAAYVPLLLLIMERYQGRRRFFYAFLGALILGLVLLIGHVQYVLYIGMLLLFYAAFLLMRALLRKSPATEVAALAVCAVITAVGAVLIGALELLLNYEVIGYSSRIARTFSFTELFTILGRVPYRWLVTLAFPDYFGSPVLRFNLFPSQPMEYLNYNELCLYMGIPTLFAFLALALRPRTAHARFFIGLTVVITAMLAGSVLFYPFFKWYPGLGRLNPTRMIFIFVFAAAAAAGLGIRNIEESVGKQRRIFLAAVLGLTGIVVALALFSSSRGALLFFNNEQLGAGSAPRLFEELKGLRVLSSPVIMKPLVITLLAGAIFSVWAWFGNKRWVVLCPVLLTALLGYDLITFGWNYNTQVEQKFIYPLTPSLAFLQQQPGPFRVVQDGGQALFVNALQPYGIQEVGGYMSAYPDRVNKLMSSIEFGARAGGGMSFDRWVVFRNVRNPLFDLLNVRYVLTAPHVRVPENQKYKLVFSGDMSIYENLRVLPRAFAVHRPIVLKETSKIITYMNSDRFDPRAEVILEEEPPAGFAGEARAVAPSAVNIDRYDFDEVLLTAELATNGWVVLSDTFYPGWEAEVDGRKARILRADCALRAVPVPAGKHQVAFRYRPAARVHGGLISLFGLFLVIMGMGYSIRRRRKA